MDLGAQTAAKRKNGNGKGGKPATGGKSAREAYYDKISKLDMAPLWVVLKDIIPDEPKTVMSPGDFVLTPSGTIHDHGNESKKSMIWLDVLDVPTINFFETCFYEHFDYKRQNTRRDDGDSLVRYGSGVLPDGQPHRNSPIVNYPYAKMRPILERLAAEGDIDPRHGARFRYANPLTGGPVMPTMGAHLALLPKNFKGKDYQATDSTIFVCVEGEGTTKVGGQTLEWGPRDVFVVPSWMKHSHQAKKETVLFSISDRPAQEALGIWREQS